MGSHVRKKRFSVFLTAVASALLIGLLSPPTLAGASVDKQKLSMLELLGLDAGDPAVVKSAREANALYSIDVTTGDKDVNVVLELSGTPTYNSYLYRQDRRLVVDLRNTINLVSASNMSVGENDPVKSVRNSQYRVEPSLISRVVLDLQDNAEPEIVSSENKVIITTAKPERPATSKPASEQESNAGQGAEFQISESDATDAESLEQEPESAEEILSTVVQVPVVDVEDKSPDVDVMVARTESATDSWKFAADKSLKTQYEDIKSSEDAEEIVEQTVVPAEETETAVNDTAEQAGETPVVDSPESVETDEAKDAEDIVSSEEQTENEPEIVAALSDNPEPRAEDASQPTAEGVEAEASAEENPVQKTVLEPVEPGEEAPMMLAAASAEAADAPKTAEQTVPLPETKYVAEQPVAKPEPEKDTIEKLVQTLAKSDVKAEISQDPVVPQEELITLTFRDADLGSVLDILARKGKFNILAGKDVRGVVTVRLVDVPLDVALDSILNVNGYGYIKSDNIIRILPLSQLGEEVETLTETYNLSYASASRVKTTLTSFLTKNGSIETDERTNMIIVTDVPGNMDRIRSLLPQIDRRVQQVLIEVLIVDSVLRDEADLGITWGLLNTVDRSPNEQAFGVPFQDQININIPIANDAGSLLFGTLMGDFKLDAFIQALVNNTNTQILANPKILTLNNQTASIEIIQEFPYNDVTQTSSGGQLSNITFKEIGTKLDVKPQITHDGHVILEVAPEQNFLAGETITGVPILDTRRAATTLIVKNHQTIVLGGLRLNSKMKRLTKVPLLGDLPGVKYAFRSTTNDKDDSELLLFLTTHIVESPVMTAEDKIKFEELANTPRKPNSQIEIIR